MTKLNEEEIEYLYAGIVFEDPEPSFEVMGRARRARAWKLLDFVARLHIEHDDQCARARMSLSYAYRKLGRQEEADKCIDEAFKTCEDQAELELEIARMLAFDGRLDQAKSHLETYAHLIREEESVNPDTEAILEAFREDREPPASALPPPKPDPFPCINTNTNPYIDFTVLSDTAGLNDRFDLSGDALIHCGNFYASGETDPGLQRLKAWFARQDFKRKFIVPGHNDYPLLEAASQGAEAIEGFEILNGKLAEIGGFKIYGASFFSRLENERFGLRSAEETLAAAEAIPDDIDLLATHMPPFGILDDSIPGTNKGCPILRERVRWIAPRYHVFGHDEGYGYDRDNGTKFNNVSQHGSFWLLPLAHTKQTQAEGHVNAVRDACS